MNSLGSSRNRSKLPAVRVAAILITYFWIIPVFMLICIPIAALAKDDSNGPFLIYSPNKKYAVLDIYRSSDKVSERRHIYFIDETKSVKHPLLLPSTGTNSYSHNVGFL